MKIWHKKNICLLGDAAHATTPNMGQGGAQAIEDAYFLAHIITKEQPSNVFHVFQRNRIKKVYLIVRQSWIMGKMAHLKNFIFLRNYILRTTPPLILKKRWSAIYKLK